MKVPSLLGYLIMRKVCANEGFDGESFSLVFLFVKVILVSSNGNSLVLLPSPAVWGVVL